MSDIRIPQNPGIGFTGQFTNAEALFLSGIADHSYTDGQLLIGNSTTGGISFATLTAGTNVTITNGHGTITIASSGGAGGGDFSSNTATSVVNEIVLFADTGGKTGKRSTGSGLALLTSGVLSTVTAPSGTVVGTSDTQTLTNKDLTSGTNTFPTFNQNTTGSAAKWTTARLLAGNSVDGSAAVPFANKFVVQGTTDTGLSGAQFLGALTTGIVKNTTTTGVLSIAAAGTDYEVPLTFSTGLTRTTNTITVNTSQNIATLSNLTSNGFVKTSGSAGTLSIDTSTYLTANQTITLSGHVTGSGTTAITTSSASKFILQGTTDATVSAAQFLGALTTGIVKNTTTTGVLSIAAAGTDYQAPITLTTTGTSGAATFISNTLNIPQYSGGGGTGITWTEITSTSQTAAINNGYILNNAGLVTLTLPSTAAVGSIVEAAGKGAGGWKIALNASGIIHFGNQNTTTGTGGSLASVATYDSVRLVCIVANNEWVVLSSVGNITVV